MFYNLLDLRSYAVARLRADFLYYNEPLPQIIARLEDPNDHHHKLVQPGGSWWLHVEHKKAEHNGDVERAAKLSEEIEQVNAKVRAVLGISKPKDAA